MPSIRFAAFAISRQSEIERRRSEARLFIDALAVRLGELEDLARLAKRFHTYNPADYAEFKALFLHFRNLSEEFQILSHLTETSLLGFTEAWHEAASEHKQLDDYFRQLQVPMLQGVISTNLLLLKVWDDRLQRGEGMPYGAYELFLETVRLIYNARVELLRPRYVDMLDDTALQDADRAERLLRTLIERAPRLFEFAAREPAAAAAPTLSVLSPETETGSVLAA